MSNETFLLFVIIVLVVVTLPSWSYSKSWGYRPTGILTALLVIFLIWAVADNRPLFRHSIGHDLRETGRDVADSIRHDVR